MSLSVNELTKEMGEKDKELIEKAYKFSLCVHEGQKRMNGDPFFTHSFETAKNLVSLGMDASTIAAGLLHDVLEDTKATEEEIKKEFGPEILFLVNGATNLSKLKYSGHERYVESLRKFFFALAHDLRVVIIKFADRLHNLQTLKDLPEAKKRRIAIESIEVYAPLANRLGMGKLKGELEDLAFPFAYPKEHAQIDNILRDKKDVHEKYLENISKKLREELEKNKIKVVQIDSRVKRKYSLWKKLVKFKMNLEDIEKIYDMVALRVVVESVEDCYRVLGIIHSVWNPLPGIIKDYISLPKPNGYQSIHTTVFTGSGETAEIQIRTREMHREASYGVASYFSYKEQYENKHKNNANNKLKFKWLEELKGLNYSFNESKKFIEHLKTDFFSDRIFIFTPEGDIVDLPEDSSALDFAYSIHSDIGNHISGVKINGKLSPIFSKLHNRDIVEIVTRSDAHPSSKWLEYTKTTLAKKHINSYLEKNSLLNKLKSLGKS